MMNLIEMQEYFIKNMIYCIIILDNKLDLTDPIFEGVEINYDQYLQKKNMDEFVNNYIDNIELAINKSFLGDDGFAAFRDFTDIVIYSNITIDQSICTTLNEANVEHVKFYNREELITELRHLLPKLFEYHYNEGGIFITTVGSGINHYKYL